jgi:pimeloyl-ACP methyl ester carboxylesterase
VLARAATPIRERTLSQVMANSFHLGSLLVRPPGWRDATPSPESLDGCLLFERDRRATSADCTVIAYTVRGRRGPWIALVPGFCCPDNFWRYLVPALERDHRVLVWDLRGLGLSGMPRDPGPRAARLSAKDFAVPKLVEDLRAVLDAEGVRRAALIGHSMGGQIVLEAWRRMPERVGAVVMLTAPFESPIRTFYGRDAEVGYQLAKHSIQLLPRSSILLWRVLWGTSPEFSHRIAQLVRALGPDAKAEDMAPYYRHMAGLDPLVVLKMSDAMHDHTAADVLGTVTVPALVVVGTKDTFTPPSLAEAMREQLPQAELVEIEGGTHGAVIEKPDEVNDAIRSFLRRAETSSRRRTASANRTSAKRAPASTRRTAKAPTS